VITVFDRIPDYFAERYNDEIEAWAANFSKIGPVKSVVLKEGPFADLSPDPEQGAVLLAVKLIAKMERRVGRVTVSPLGERDEELIRKHCEKMARLNIHPRKFWKEPARPWLPFMPTIGSA
jgi:hypothetical protein